MTHELPHPKKSRWFAAHAAIAVLALAGAIGLQWLWGPALAIGKESWWLHSSDILLLTTAWLLFTAWHHLNLIHHVGTTRQSLLQAVADIAASAIAAFILAQGHTATLSPMGLWPLMPLLIAIAAPSALILLATAMTVSNSQSSSARNTAGILRLIALSALTGYLLVLATA